MPDKKFQGSLSEHAYQVIRERILRGEYPLGAPLSRRTLAADLTISLLPVSEALQRLESEGLVESRPRVGTRVRVPTPQDIRGHYVVREALESQSARLFAGKASQEEREELARMAADLDGMFGRQEDLREFPDRLNEHSFGLHRHHMRLHMRIAECTGCDALCVAMERNQVLIFNWLYDTASAPRALPAGWHAELIRSVAGRDPEEADRAMRQHVRFGMEDVLRRIEGFLHWEESALGRNAAWKRAPAALRR